MIKRFILKDIGAGSYNDSNPLILDNIKEIGFDSTSINSSISNIENRINNLQIPSQTSDLYNNGEGGNPFITIESIPSYTGLEKIDEGKGFGWRFIGRDPENYGNIGFNAVDLTFSDNPSTTIGAIGDYSVTIGRNNSAIGIASITIGDGNNSNANHSIAFGTGNTTNGAASFAVGNFNISNGNYSATIGSGNNTFGEASLAFGSNCSSYLDFSVAIGRSVIVSGETAVAIGLENQSLATNSIVFGGGNISKTRSEMVIGVFASNLTPTAIDSNTVIYGSDYIFRVGIGTNNETRNDAFRINKIGDIEIVKEPTTLNSVVKALGRNPSGQIVEFDKPATTYSGTVNISGTTLVISNGMIVSVST